MTTLKKDCYAVIFTSKRTDVESGYAEMAQRMLILAKAMPGFIGVDSAREEVGITVSYWESEADIKRWREHPDHREAQRRGKADWYASYELTICRVNRTTSYRASNR